ncbi:cysteine-rich CWC family protein [Pseudorhodoferax sp. Leaf267]|uniref:cysteine-rich CWC family protein n=1 Tax=Pseudorhodoferax sp. Leaf267 TaxID=1736316 RepID=UPI0007161B7A|nr:cysteine-rich CWC family protein [Pseudorhodoferax sp. Leaf267]KQP21492.1 hypothetical protein ASF43_26340 [Pseudorhodoferax sp. Leaf267]
MLSPTQWPEPAMDAARCPLCGAENGCAAQAARDGLVAAAVHDCWCMVTDIAPGVLERIPAAQRGRACVCAQCARG